MAAKRMPAAEVDIDRALVGRLLRDQHPDLADLPLRELAPGWDNAMFRLGDELVVRLPRREASALLVEHEQRWLPELAPVLPLAVPVPVRVGRPQHGYPWSWSVVAWRPGAVATDVAPAEPSATAEALGGFLRALHRPAPPDAPANPVRGVPLDRRTAALHEQCGWLGPAVDRVAVLDRWEDLVVTPAWDRPPVWLHGDLHPANIVVDGGRVVAVIDFGDITAGDPATDLSVAWMLLPPAARAGFRSAADDVDDATWRRAEAWALALGVAYLARSADNPRMAGVGRRTLDAVLAERG